MHRPLSTLTTLVLAALPFSCGGASPDRPNVVLVALDTLRPDYLDAYGYPRETAPFLARLAEEGALFRRAYSSSSWTAPSTASLVTGLYPDRHGVTKGFLANFRAVREADEPEEEVELLAIDTGSSTLAERFRSAGYTTIGIGTNINIGTEIGFDRGFDLFERHDGWSAGKVYQRLDQWDGGLSASEPFFLYLHLNDVHKPYEPRRRWIGEPVDLFVPPSTGEREEAELRETVTLYQSEIGYLDHWLGRILEELVPSENTIVCVVSDHGEEFMDHGMIGHHFSLHAEVNRIVLLLHAPGSGVQPVAPDVPISIVDVAPTLLELAGLDVTGELDGRSVAPLVTRDAGGAAIREELATRPLFAHRWSNDHEMWAVVHEGWKLLDGPRGQQLYHLAVDPTERRNLLSEEPERAQGLRVLLDEYRARGYRPQSRRTTLRVGDDLLERLQQLGYVDR